MRVAYSFASFTAFWPSRLQKAYIQKLSSNKKGINCFTRKKKRLHSQKLYHDNPSKNRKTLPFLYLVICIYSSWKAALVFVMLSFLANTLVEKYGNKRKAMLVQVIPLDFVASVIHGSM